MRGISEWTQFAVQYLFSTTEKNISRVWLVVPLGWMFIVGLLLGLLIAHMR